jgi:hypothetical protein
MDRAQVAANCVQAKPGTGGPKIYGYAPAASSPAE